MISDEELFVWDTDALRGISRNPEPRNLLEASNILRRMLMDDGTPLLLKVAKRLDVKPRFRVYEASGKKEFSEYYDKMPVKRGLKHVFINPDPSLSPAANMKDVDIGEFLAMPFHNVAGTNISVKDIISYCANVSGGVHKGEPRKKGNAETLHTTANDLWMNSRPYPLESLRIIASMTIPTLMPLYFRLRA